MIRICKKIVLKKYPNEKRVVLMAAMAIAASFTASFTASCSGTSAGTSKNPVVDKEVKALARNVQEVAGAGNAVGFDLIKKLAEKDAKGNIFISPSSISSACTMAYFGAEGPCKDEMAKVLKLPSVSAKGSIESFKSGLSQDYRELNKSLSELGQKCQFNNANAIFVDSSFKFTPAYTDFCSKAFGAESKSLPLNTKEGIKAVNDWVKDKTANKIPELIDSPITDIAAILTNAVYFKGSWKTPFEKERTSEAEFHNADGSTGMVQMMGMDGDLQGYAGEGFKAVALPYEGKRLIAYFLLPDSGTALGPLLRDLNPENWKKWLSSFSKKEEAVLAMPRFKINYGSSLVNSFKQLGMTKAFDFEQADFSSMFENNEKRIRIGDIVHKSFVQVNEEGTEAAAATAVEMQCESARVIPDRFVLTIDRPFIFAIADQASGSIIFIGAIQKLDKESSN